jgi:hypothetical protein
VHTRLRLNERLAIERSQQTDVRDCQETLLQKGSKRTLSVEKLYKCVSAPMKSSLQRDPEGPSQPHVRPGTQSMSRLSNSKRRRRSSYTVHS